ncbi:unnamed protein product [Victoria cruziana]
MARDRPFTANLGLGAKSGRRKARNSQPPLTGHQPGQLQATVPAAPNTDPKASLHPTSEANSGRAESPAQPPQASLPSKPAGGELGAGSNRATASPSHPRPSNKGPSHQGIRASKGPSPSSHQPSPKEKAAQDPTTLASLSPAQAELAPAGFLAQQEPGPSIPSQQSNPPQKDLPHSPTGSGAAAPPEEEDLKLRTGPSDPAPARTTPCRKALAKHRPLNA